MTIQRPVSMHTFAFVVLSAAIGRSAPLGAQFRVNPSSAGDQYAGATAASTNGDSVVLWQDSGGCFVQRYDAAGRSLYRGGIRVTQSTAMSQTSVVIALDDIGNLIVVEEAGDGSGLGIFATIYDRAGAVIVPRFRINLTTAGTQAGPQVAVNGQQELVISWVSQGPSNPDGSSTYRPVVRRFHGDGTPVTSEIFLNGPTNSMAGVAIGESGSFVVTYTIEKLGVGGYGDVFMRRFDAFGGAVGSELRVNTTTTGLQRQSRIAMERGSEQFVIVWESYDAADGWRERPALRAGRGATRERIPSGHRSTGQRVAARGCHGRRW
jgi:hypothetical protein